MAKKQKISKKKSKSTARSVAVPITSLCNVSGLQDESDPFANDTATNELDDCLAMMGQSFEPSGASDSSQRASDTKEQPISNKLWKGPGKSNHASKPAPVDFVLPNIQVELARHKHMGDLSTFLLSKCKHLRMPAFERWLIDSKMEERSKRQAIKENAEILASQDQHASNKKAGRNAKWESRLKRKRRELRTPLENHMTSSGLRASNDHDPCIPSMADVEDEASQQLIKEMEQGDNGDGFNATDLCKQLCQLSCTSARHLQNLGNQLSSVSSSQYFGKTCGRIVLETNTEATTSTAGNSSYSLVYSRKPNGENKAKPFVVKINTNHYEKLREMFHSVHDTTAAAKPMNVAPPYSLGKNPNKYSPATNIFHHLIFCITIRYSSLSGAQLFFDLRGGGMQGAIHSEVFECLAKHGHSEDILECFASPLNAYNSRYFSIFHQDLDWHFGSVGDFFSTPSRFFRHGGVHEANPPFSPGMMQYMVERMEEHLRFADSMSAAGKRCPLSFVIIVPSCSSKGSGHNLIQEFAAKSFRRMLRSKHFSKHIVLNAREHGYIEGSQHLRPTRFKESQYDTSAIVLQSKDAKEQEGNKVVGTEFEADLRKAFASRHQMELEERRNDSIIGNTVDEDTKVTEQEPEIEKKRTTKKSKKKRMKK